MSKNRDIRGDTPNSLFCIRKMRRIIITHLEQNLKSGCAELITPRETVYSVMDTEIQQKLGLTAFTE
jgi:hypothetical protein